MALAVTGVAGLDPVTAVRYLNTLATVGILQYIAPTLQFLLGVFVYGEPFTRTRLVGFAAIWIALLIYSVEGVVRERRQRVHALPAG